MEGGIFPSARNVEVQKWHVYVAHIVLSHTHDMRVATILYVYCNTNSEKR